MRFRLSRFQFTDQATIGKLSIDGIFAAYTLERVADGRNTPNVSAINEGTYRVIERFSPHFGYNVLAVCDVPGRTDIEIHMANCPDELRGCIAVGEVVDADGPPCIRNSREAFAVLMDKFREPATLQIESVHLTPEVEA